jgi:hypothetical protein
MQADVKLLLIPYSLSGTYIYNYVQEDYSCLNVSKINIFSRETESCHALLHSILYFRMFRYSTIIILLGVIEDTSTSIEREQLAI